MEFKGLKLDDLLIMNDNIYRVTHMISTPKGYTIHITHFPTHRLGLPITVTLTGKDYTQLQEVGSIYYLGNLKENEALGLLYN